MVSFRHSDIFRHMDRLRAEMEAFASMGARLGSEAPGADDLWAPPVDIQETDESLLLTVDLPGVARESIGLEVDADSLTLQGERVCESSGRSVRLERPAGRFLRSFRIGVPIDPTRVEAKYRDGVLAITLPKVDRRGPTQLRIDVE